jgi:hypothetical protein
MKLEEWMHRCVARDVTCDDAVRVTLELGAGTLNQLQWEPCRGAYDVVEPFAQLYAASPAKSRVRAFYRGIDDVPAALRYDRITATAVFEHVTDLPDLVAKSGRLLCESGVFRVAIPSEGTLLWWLGWRCTTGLEFALKYRHNYGLLMRHEHVNTAEEIETVLRYFFGKVSCRVFGLNRSFSLYRYYECRDPSYAVMNDFVSLKKAEQARGVHA